VVAAALRIERLCSQRFILVSHREHLVLDLRISRSLREGAELPCVLSKSLCSLLWSFHTDLSATTVMALASGITVAGNLYSNKRSPCAFNRLKLSLGIGQEATPEILSVACRRALSRGAHQPRG
jgi:hypothetical protein